MASITKRKVKKISDEIRELLIFAYIDGIPVAKSCKVLRINERTAYAIVKKFTETNEYLRRKSSGRKVSFDENIENEVVKYFEAEPKATLRECRNYFCLDPNKQIPSVSTIARILKKRGIALKVKPKVPHRRRERNEAQPAN